MTVRGRLRRALRPGPSAARAGTGPDLGEVGQEPARSRCSQTCWWSFACGGLIGRNGQDQPVYHRLVPFALVTARTHHKSDKHV